MAIDDSFIDGMTVRLSRLARLVLYGGVAAPQETHAQHVARLLRELEHDCAGEDLRGLAHLFRLLHKLPSNWPLGGVAAADRIALAGWVCDLRTYLLGGISDDSVGDLVDAPFRLSWMPELETRTAKLVGTALAEHTALLGEAARQRAAARRMPAARQADVAGTAALAFSAADAYEDHAFYRGAAESAPTDTAVVEAQPVPAGIAADQPPDSHPFEDHAFDSRPPPAVEAPLFADLPSAEGGAAVRLAAATADAVSPATRLAADECSRICDAVTTQLLPAVTALLEADVADAAAPRRAAEGCSALFGQILAALRQAGVTPLAQVAEGYAALLRQIADGAGLDDDEAHTLGLWPVLLLGYLRDSEDMANCIDLVVVLHERDLLADVEAGVLARRLASIRIDAAAVR